MNERRLPAEDVRKKPFLLQIRPRRLKDLVVTTRHYISLAFQGDGKLMHHAAANSNKMYVHSLFFTPLFGPLQVKVFKINLLAKKLPNCSRGGLRMSNFCF